jgi:CS domain
MSVASRSVECLASTFHSPLLAHTLTSNFNQGVQIVTPDERKVSKVASAIREADALPEEVTLVYMPADATLPLQEVTYPQSSWASTAPHESNADLLDFLKPRFQTPNADVDLSRLDSSAQTLLAGSTNGPGATLPKVSEATLRTVAQEVHIETFTVVHSVDRKPSLVMYLDEIGALKRLPVNSRAASYAARAGYNPPPVFYGDVYASRICPVTRRNASCRIEDLERVGEHLVNNLTHQMEQNRMLGRPDARQPDAAGSGDNAQSEDGFSWRQTEQELEVTVPISGGGGTILTSRQVKVQFKPQTLHLSIASSEPPVSLLIRLFERVDVDSCTWTLDQSKKESEEDAEQVLVVSMEKVEEAFWPRIQD